MRFMNLENLKFKMFFNYNIKFGRRDIILKMR